jgi:hypothetical protein
MLSLGTECLADELELAATLEDIEALEEELRDAEFVASGTCAEFWLSGAPLDGHDIAADVLAGWLSHMQRLVRVVGNERGGRSGTRGNVTSEVADSHTLRVVPERLAASYGIRVRVGPPDTSRLFSVDPQESLEEACGLVGQAGSTDFRLDSLASARVQSTLAELLEVLADNSADVAIRTRHVASSRRVTSIDAGRVLGGRPPEAAVPECKTVTGRWIAGRVEGGRKYVNVVTDDGASYSCTPTPEAVEAMTKVLMRQRVVVDIIGDQAVSIRPATSADADGAATDQ